MDADANRNDDTVVPPAGGAPRAASNPWDCLSARRKLPPPRLSPAQIIQSLARTLHYWPDEVPCHLLKPEARRRRLAEALAGYPEIARGSQPFDDLFHRASAGALGLTLALDSCRPLASRESLRAELMWLDQLARGAVRVSSLDLDPNTHLSLSIAWLLAGLASATGTEPEASNVLVHVLFDPELIDREVSEIRCMARALMRSSQPTGPTRRDFGLVAPGQAPRECLGSVAERVWWAIHAQPLDINRKGTCQPPQVESERNSAIEFRFHGIQRWILSPIRSVALNQPLTGAAVKGASALLEAALSAVRQVVLSELGPGAVIIDGGGRVRVAAPRSEEKRSAVGRSVVEALERLFSSGSVGRKFPALFNRLTSPGGDEQSAAQDSVADLFWATLPPFSITARHGDDITGNEVYRQVPVRRSNCMPPPPVPRPGGAWLREDLGLAPDLRTRVEMGVLVPRVRYLGAALSRDTSTRSACALQTSTKPLLEVLYLDLNRVGRLFKRPRGDIDLQAAAARRSLRFNAGWLLAVFRAVSACGTEGAVEVLALGGDDLVVGTRSKTYRMIDFVRRLATELDAINEELPPCEAISFAAGLALREQGASAGSVLLRASSLEHVAKELWAARAADVPIDDKLREASVAARTHWVGSGRGMSLVVEGGTAGTVPASEPLAERVSVAFDGDATQIVEAWYAGDAEGLLRRIMQMRESLPQSRHDWVVDEVNVPRTGARLTATLRRPPVIVDVKAAAACWCLIVTEEPKGSQSPSGL